MGQAARRDTRRDAPSPVTPWATPEPEPPPGAAMPPSERESAGAAPWVVHAPQLGIEPTPRVGAVAPHRAEWTWLSAHGGAGSTSLVAGSGRGIDLTRLWPDPAQGWPATVVLVARSSIAGLEAAARVLAEHASGTVPDLQVVALVVIADAPSKTSRLVRTRVRELSGTVPTLIEMGWIDTWRDKPFTPHKSARSVADAVAARIAR